MLTGRPREPLERDQSVADIQRDDRLGICLLALTAV